MATKNLNQLTTTASAASGDLVAIWRVANGDTRAITKANFMGGVLTGGGTLATGGFTLTVSGTSTINGSVVGSMTGSGTVATGGNTLTVAGTSTINGSLVGSMTGSGTVATGGFTLTVPATGTASLLGTAQTYSALKTFSAGLTFGGSTLNTYTEATSFTPVFADASSGGNVASVGAAAGWYTRIGNRVWVDMFFDNISTSGLTSGNPVYVRGLPFSSLNSANYRATGSVYFSRINYTDRFVSAFLITNTTYLTLQSHPNTGSATPTAILVSDLTGGTGFVDLVISISYLV